MPRTKMVNSNKVNNTFWPGMINDIKMTVRVLRYISSWESSVLTSSNILFRALLSSNREYTYQIRVTGRVELLIYMTWLITVT